MQIIKFLNFALRLPLSQEQRERAKRGMEIIDITVAAPVSSASKGDNGIRPFDDYSSAKHFIQGIFHFALKKIGIKRNMKNFSKDFPINTLGGADSEFISRLAAGILKDEATAQRFQNAFFGLFGEEYDSVLAEYAKKKGKTLEKLTDDEHNEAAHNFTVMVGATVFSELLRAQKAEEIFDIAKNALSFEDFGGKVYECNFDWINFFRSYHHTRTKHGEIVNIEDVEKEISINNGIKRLEDSFNINELLEQLSEEEREILKLKEDGYREAKIAEELGYKSQGTVSKKIKKMGKKIEDYLK